MIEIDSQDSSQHIDMVETGAAEETLNGTVKTSMRTIIRYIDSFIDRIHDEDIDNMIDAMLSAEKIFIVGRGRSGLVGRAFAMRLMHLDLNVHVVGETTTPSFAKNDVLIAISGSGETSGVLVSAEVAIKRGGKVVAITSYPKSMLARMADVLVIVKGRSKEPMPKSYSERELTPKDLAPLGTLFEDTCMLFFDGVIACLMKKLEKKEEDMQKKHSVLD